MTISQSGASTGNCEGIRFSRYSSDQNIQKVDKSVRVVKKVPGKSIASLKKDSEIISNYYLFNSVDGNIADEISICSLLQQVIVDFSCAKDDTSGSVRILRSGAGVRYKSLKFRSR